MSFDYRAVTIKKLVSMGWGWSTPSPAEMESMVRYYEAMSDEDLYDELSTELYKAGQDSMRY